MTQTIQKQMQVNTMAPIFNSRFNAILQLFLFLKFFCERRLSERDHEKNIFPFPHKRYITFIFSVKNLENLCGSYSITFLKRSSFLKAIQTVDNVIMQKGI